MATVSEWGDTGGSACAVQAWLKSPLGPECGVVWISGNAGRRGRGPPSPGRIFTEEDDVMGSSWRETRIAFVVGALTLLAGTPAVLRAAGIKNLWALAGATSLAVVVVAVGTNWQDKYRRVTERRDEQRFKVKDDCLVLPDGRLPRVRDITDPRQLGVHRAIPSQIASGGHPDRPTREYVPAFVPRDIDSDLRQCLAVGGFVLLAGDSTAGKTRAGFEAMRAMLADHLLICPNNREAAPAAARRAAQERRCVLWLDELERYLGTGGLTVALLNSRMLTGAGHYRVIIATIRAAETGADHGRQPVG